MIGKVIYRESYLVADGSSLVGSIGYGQQTITRMKSCYLIMFVIFGLLTYSCDFVDSRLSVENRTAYSICVQDVADTHLLSSDFNASAYYLERQIKPGDCQSLITVGRDGWIQTIENSLNHKLNLVIFNSDTVKKYNSIDELIARDLYVIMSFSKEKLEEAKWNVVIE